MAQGHDLFETRHRHKDGHELDIEVSASYLADTQQFISFCRDITERKLSEQELKIAAATFEAHDAIMIADADALLSKLIKHLQESLVIVLMRSWEEIPA